MKLGDFIKQFVERNTSIRLWRKLERNGHLMLTQDVPLMEWEILDIPELSDLEFDAITDILCDNYKEAVNICVKNMIEPAHITVLVNEYHNKRDKERGAMSDAE